MVPHLVEFMPYFFSFDGRLLGWALVLVLGLAGAPRGARAQGTAAYGEWQLHLPTTQPLVLADAGERVYVAAEASFYFFDKNLNTLRLLSRRDGLSDVGVRTLAYDPATQQLLVAYRNGNLDVLRPDGSVRNVTDILRKNLQGGKVINDIYFSGGQAYLSSNFGLVVLDMAKLEVQDTYVNIGRNGLPVEVRATAVLRDTIYAATSGGLLRSRLNAGLNLLDYRSWTPDMPAIVPNTGDRPTTLGVHNGRLYAGFQFGLLYEANGRGPARAWRSVANSYADYYYRLRSAPEGLLVLAEGGGVRRYDRAANTLVSVLPAPAAGSARDAVRSATDGALYVASYTLGLLRQAAGGGAPEAFAANAPAFATPFSLSADAASNTVTAFSGGYSDRYIPAGQRGGWAEYRDGQWTNVNAKTLPSPADFPNPLDATRGVRAPSGALYVASFGNGLLEWRGPGQFRQFTALQPGSPLQGFVGLPTSDPYYLSSVRLTDVAADAGGNLWTVNRHGRGNVSGAAQLRPASGTWRPLPYFAGSEALERVVVDDFGTPWFTSSRKDGVGGVVAYDTASRTPFFFGTSNGLPNTDLYDIAKDRKGDIWVATGDGVAVFADPSQVVAAAAGGQPLAAGFRTPIVTRGTPTPGFPALFNTAVRCLAVDGGNRKWFGTEQGLWLFSEDADEPLLHFTTENSPLPSNRIVDVAVNDKTGDVFVATDGGLVSYRGAASVTEGTPNCAAVAPNPVPSNFSGTVGLSGVANNAYVKITDVAGHLVYSTRASGGTVTWNLNDVEGRRVRSGVYLVLTSDADGGNTCVSKVAVLGR